jgi:AAA domain
MANQKSNKPYPNGASQTHPATGSYFRSLELEYLRCFSQNQVLDLSDGRGRPARWTILLGENGTGKTTILQLLASFDRVLEPVLGGSFTRHGHSGLLFTFPATETITRDPSGPFPRFSINALLGLNLASDKDQLLAYGCNGSCDSKNAVTITIDAQSPPKCYAYGTGRRLAASSLSSTKSDSATESLFFEDTNLLNAEDWLLTDIPHIAG